MARDESAGKLDVTVLISQLAFEALMDGRAAEQDQIRVRMESALRCYLADRDKDRPAWPYPGFLRGSETQADVQVDFTVPADLWGEFTEEGTRQGVTVEQLAEHAAFYLAAELEAGRVTERILAELEEAAD